MRIKVCFVYFIMSLNLYNDTFDVAVNHVFFFFILEAIFFCFSDWQNFCFIFSTKKEKLRFFFIMLSWTLNFRVRLYFISQNVVIFFYFASFVLMLDVLFLSLGHYLIFKRAFKKWKCFWNLICEVYFMNDFFF